MRDINFERNYSAFIGTVQPAAKTPGGTEKTSGAAQGPGFSELLRQKLEESTLTVSKHAAQRLESRNIELSPALYSQLNAAVDRASGKGIRDALILGQQAAFIVNVPSRTVVTAMSGSEMTGGVYTNIDGAVLL